jgi:hypothetical protein
VDVKERLAKVIARDSGDLLDAARMVELCRDAAAEIERLESRSVSDRVTRLEALVCMLARGILQHEYSKDLCRHGTEAACDALANDSDLEKAVSIIASSR